MKKIILFLPVFLVAILLILPIIFPEVYLGSIIERAIYWIILFFIVSIVIFYHTKTILVLSIALFFTILAAILNIITLNNLSELVMKISYIFWLVGIFKGCFEYRKSILDS